MCNFTKEEANIFKDITYLRILGFSEKGKTYLNSIKKQINLPFVTNFNKNNDKMLDLEFRTTCVYASILDESEKTKLIEMEYKNSPIRINKNGFNKAFYCISILLLRELLSSCLGNVMVSNPSLN